MIPELKKEIEHVRQMSETRALASFWFALAISVAGAVPFTVELQSMRREIFWLRRIEQAQCACSQPDLGGAGQPTMSETLSSRSKQTASR